MRKSVCDHIGRILVLSADRRHRSTVIQGPSTATDVAHHSEFVLLLVDCGIGGGDVDLQAITKFGSGDLVMQLDVRQV